MYCPKCGSQTPEDGKFCRSCGSDVSLVPLALTGQLPPSAPSATSASAAVDGAKHLSAAISNSITGVGFVVVAFSVLLFAPAGRLWWFWMLIPAFSLLASGLAALVRYRAATGGLPGAR